MAPTGFKPVPARLSGLPSIWCGRWDLNPHAEATRFKLATYAIPPRPRCFGAPGEIRTHDLSVMSAQLWTAKLQEHVGGRRRSRSPHAVVPTAFEAVPARLSGSPSILVIVPGSHKVRAALAARPQRMLWDDIYTTRRLVREAGLEPAELRGLNPATLPICPLAHVTLI